MNFSGGPSLSAPYEFLLFDIVLVSIELLACVYYIFWVETRAKGLSWNLKSIGTAFNISLLGMIVSLLLAFTCTVPDYFDYALSPADFFSTVFLAVFETSYLYYSWARGKDVVENVFPRLVKFLTLLINASPFICLIQSKMYSSMAVLVWCGTNDFMIANEYFWYSQVVSIAECCSAAAGILAVTFDLLLLVSFITFLKSTLAGLTIDKRFVIISAYGACAVVSLLVGVATYIRSNQTGSVMMLQVTYFFLWLTSFILFAMKVALNFEKDRKASVHASLLGNGVRSVEGAATLKNEHGKKSARNTLFSVRASLDRSCSFAV
ncbi:hypothetical protein HDU98_008821 [Podochytrium sp. JEL0797]|nr:hypothetical protein HDU98_008821 [Podochytrium sp. JEL0797]